MNTNEAVKPDRDVIRVPTWATVIASRPTRNLGQTDGVIRVPTWAAVIASAVVLTVAYAIYCYITAGDYWY